MAQSVETIVAAGRAASNNKFSVESALAQVGMTPTGTKSRALFDSCSLNVSDIGDCRCD